MKKITLQQLKTILATLPPNPRIVASGNHATPTKLLETVNTEIETFTLHMLNAQKDIPKRDGITYETAFVGSGMRRTPNLQYIPARLSMIPVMLKTTLIPDIVLLHTSAIKNNTVSLGIEVNILPAAIEAVRERGGIVIAQANPNMPYTFGDAVLYEYDIDYIIEVDEPISVKAFKEPSDISKNIGERIVNQIENGSTLQLGIGGIPDAVLEALGNRKGLRLWTEMFTDGVLNLYNKGSFDNIRPLTSSFLFGTQNLYDWIESNPQLRMLRTEKVNDPANIAKHLMMTSINSALQVDLFAQANASVVKNNIYSGFGGSTDFIVGALHAQGGKSFIALPSWHPKADVSTVVPILTTPVTSFQQTAIVTENGSANIFGRTVHEQAHNIIENIAHDSVKDYLREEAKKFGLQP